jgi:hypothetical protein
VATTLPLPDVPESPLAEGDVFVRFAGKQPSSLAQLMEIFKSVEVGSTFKVTVKRGEESLDLELKKDAPPEGLMIRSQH